MLKKSLVALCGALILSPLYAEPVMAQSRTGESANEPPVTDGRSRTRANRRNAARQPAQMTPEAIKAEAEAALAAGSTACTVTDQRMLGMTGENAKLFEVACDSAPGYLVVTSTPPQIIDCVLVDHTAKQMAAQAAAEPAAEGAPAQSQPTCELPGNKDIEGFLKGYATQAGVPCTVDQARVMGQSSSGAVIYEIGCAGADGYWIEKAASGWTKTECLQVLAQKGACGFTTPEEQSATVKSWLTGTEAADCDVQQVRLMGQNANGRFVELTCAGSTGIIIRHNAEFAVQQVYPCETAQAIGDGCNLPGNKPEEAPQA